jgi:hypothetical protein
VFFVLEQVEVELFVKVFGAQVRQMDRHIGEVAGGFAPNGSQDLFFQLREVAAGNLSITPGKLAGKLLVESGHANPVARYP